MNCFGALCEIGIELRIECTSSEGVVVRKLRWRGGFIVRKRSCWEIITTFSEFPPPSLEIYIHSHLSL